MATEVERAVERRLKALELAVQLHPETVEALLSAARTIEDFMLKAETGA